MKMIPFKYQLSLLALILLVSCKKAEIPTYSGAQYLYFKTLTADTTTLMYLNYPSHEDVTVPVCVKLIGNPMPYDRTYKVNVNAASTATFSLPDKIVFGAGKVLDTLRLKVSYNASLAQTEALISITLAQSDEFKPGPKTNRTYVMRVNDFIAKPTWWDEYLQPLIGAYNDKKYREFIKATGVSDLTPYLSTYNDLLSLCNTFKYYLYRERDKGNEITNPIVDGSGGGSMIDDLNLNVLVG